MNILLAYMEAVQYKQIFIKNTRVVTDMEY